MAIYFQSDPAAQASDNGIVLQGGSGGTISITSASTSDVLYLANSSTRYNTTDSSLNPLVPRFKIAQPAGNQTIGTAAGWQIVNKWTYTSGGGGGYVNHGGGFSTSTYKFTVPQTGLYLFTTTGWAYYANSTTPGYYGVHWVFTINGDSGARRPTGTPFTMRNTRWPPSRYDTLKLEEILWCNIGDTVDVFAYNFTAVNSMVGDYMEFTGLYLGSGYYGNSTAALTEYPPTA